MPFTVTQFLDVFARYNPAIWPLQILAVIAGLVVVALLFRPGRRATWAIAAILAAMWAVNAIGYHWLHFAAINPAARIFGLAFLVQALALLAAPVVDRGLAFALRSGPRAAVALALIAFAMLVYPLWGVAAGHRYPALPMFGVAPCPTTIFTIGVLLLGPWRTVRWLLVIPLLWSGVGGSAAVLLGIPQDFGLIAAGLLALSVAVARWLDPAGRQTTGRVRRNR